MILLIVVVCAGGFLGTVFYLEFSEPCCGGPPIPPTAMAPAFDGTAICGTGPSATYNLSLNPSATATTATFAAKIEIPASTLLTLGTQGTANNEGSHCDPSDAATWYGVLWSASGVTLATFTTGGTSGWTATGVGALPVTITSGMTLEVVSGAGNMDVGNDTIQFYGLGDNSVTGSTTL